jgi:predicted RNA binding protein YcfA (HicA-like mRNA interferase family)
MPLKPLAYREVRQKLLAAGFYEVGQQGSHVKFARQGTIKARIVIVPHHRRDITIGIIRSILRQADITPEEWDLL